MLSCLQRNIKKCDQIGSKLSFTFEGNQIIKSTVGGLLSILIFCVFIASVCYFSINLVLRKNPIVQNSNEIVEDPTIYLDEFPIPFTFISNSSQDLYKNVEFRKSIELNVYIRLLNLENEKQVFENITYDLKVCDFDALVPYGLSFKPFISSSFTYLCLDVTSGRDSKGIKVSNRPYISKEDFSPDSARLSLNISKCNEEINPGCGAFLERNQSFVIVTSHMKTIVDVNNFENPLRERRCGLRDNVSVGLFVESFFEFEFNELDTDSDLFFSNSDKANWTNLSWNTKNISTSNSADRLLYRINFTVNNSKVQINRQYTKIPEMMASIGGLFKVILCFSKVIANLFSNYEVFSAISKAIKVKERKSPYLIRNLSEGSQRVDNSQASIVKQFVKVPLWKFVCNMMRCTKIAKIQKPLDLIESKLDFECYFKHMMMLDLMELPEHDERPMST